MKKDYSYCFNIHSAVYGYDINTTYFDEMSNGKTNIYLTTIEDRETKGDGNLKERYSYSREEAQKAHLEEVQNCLDGKYDNHFIEFCPNCNGCGFIYKDGNWLNIDENNIEECHVCHGDSYKVVARE